MAGGKNKSVSEAQGKNKSVSEALNDASGGVNGSHGDGRLNDLVAALIVNDDLTESEDGSEEETGFQDSEGEGAEEEVEEQKNGNGLSEKYPGPISEDGLYIIEAIRHKRVRQGNTQYLIKWHGWPETENTWEPMENLESVHELVAAFENSLSSGKNHKRKGKQVVHHTQPKKRQERASTSYSLRPLPNIADNVIMSAPLHGTHADPAFPRALVFTNEEENNGNGPSNASNQIAESDDDDDSDYDPKLSELKAAAAAAATINGAKTSTENGHMDGQLKANCTEPDQCGPHRGAKKRKSGPAKRLIITESCAGEPVNTQSPASTSVGTFEPERSVANGVGNNDAQPACEIVKIIRPIGLSDSLHSNSTEKNVVLTFVVKRSDGSELIVDNRYLKENKPFLLFDFYEQHLRYGD